LGAHERVRRDSADHRKPALTGMAIGAAGCGFRRLSTGATLTFCFVAMTDRQSGRKDHYNVRRQVTFPILYRAAAGNP